MGAQPWAIRYFPDDSRHGTGDAGCGNIGGADRFVLQYLFGRVRSRRLSMLVRPAIQLLAGIPSVVYGFWGLIFIVPAIRVYLGGGVEHFSRFRHPGHHDPADSDQHLRSFDHGAATFAERGAFALGATHWQTIRSVLLPAAKSGILASIILGIGRAVGKRWR